MTESSSGIEPGRALLVFRTKAVIFFRFVDSSLPTKKIQLGTPQPPLFLGAIWDIPHAKYRMQEITIDRGLL